MTNLSMDKFWKGIKNYEEGYHKNLKNQNFCKLLSNPLDIGRKHGSSLHEWQCPQIKTALRHKSVLNTMKYIHTVKFKDEDFEETTVTAPEEVRQLGKNGWLDKI